MKHSLLSSKNLSFRKGFEKSDYVLDHLLNKGIVTISDSDEDATLHNLHRKITNSKVLTLIINPTENCNFRCKYCYESFKAGLMDKSVRLSIIEYVSNNIARYDSLVVMWFGGEPLLGLPVIKELSTEFIGICRNHNKPYSAQITTNGFLLSYEVFVELVKLHVSSYQITVDAPREIHDSQRVDSFGNGTYGRIMSNLISIKSGRKYPVNIILRTNFTTRTYNEIDKYLCDFCPVFSDDKRFSFDIHLVGNWLGKTDESLISELGDSNLYRKIFRRILEYPGGTPNLTTLYMNPGESICVSARKNSYLLSSKGVIHKCTLAFEDTSSAGEIKNDTGFNISEDRDRLWLCRENYCLSEKKCRIAPLCLGEICPLLRLNNERKIGQKLCPEINSYIDLYLQCLHKHKSFERITFKKNLRRTYDE